MPTWKVHEEMEKIASCDHAKMRATRAIKSNGVACVYMQCTSCGEKVREVAKKDYNVTILPAFDENLRRFHRERRQEKRQDLQQRWLQELKAEQTDQDAEFWRTYTAYLNSDHWRTLRLAVIERDGRKCQNCFCPVKTSNAHAHHTSYVGFQRLGYSFAFECVTLCRSCHDDFHGGLESTR